MPSVARPVVALLSISLAALGCGGGEDGESASAACDLGPAVSATATWYDAGAEVVGACGYASPGTVHAAVGAAVYDGSAACGTCLEIWGPDGKVVVPVVDRCPECAGNELDLSRAAFDAIADPATGSVAVTWRRVACTPPGPVRFRVDEGSNEYYLAVRVLDHRFPIAAVELRPAGATGFTATTRQDYNAFTATGAPFATPLELRATDVFGHAVTATLESIVAPADVDADGQLALTCGS